MEAGIKNTVGAEIGVKVGAGMLVQVGAADYKKLARGKKANIQVQKCTKVYKRARITYGVY